MNVKLLLVDDHTLLRSGLKTLAAEHPNLVIVGEAMTGADALRLAGELKPDLVVMDIHLPDTSGVHATRQLLATYPSMRVLVLSSNITRSSVDEALRAGARGYVSKAAAAEEFIHAVELVMAGKLFLSPDVGTDILQDYQKILLQGLKPSTPLLSDRERRVLRLVAEGQRNKEVASELGISTKTVEATRSRMMKKLGYSSSAELVRYAIREGLVTM